MKKDIRNEAKLGKAEGLYSQGIRCGNQIYTTQIGKVAGGALVGEGMYEQAIHTLRNAEDLLSAEGASLNDVVKCTIYIVDMADYAELNRAYQEMMPKPYPARACVQISRLSPGSKVEMEFIADVSGGPGAETREP